MSKIKTREISANPREFLEGIEPDQKCQDSLELLHLFQKTTGEKPVMWGSSIIGFGKYHYKSERSRQEGDWPLVGFSPRKLNLTLYIMAGNQDNPDFQKLGKHSKSVGCLYLKKLSDVDINILESMIHKSYQYMKTKFA